LRKEIAVRTIEEIQAELNALEASPSYYGNEWKKPRREWLKGELFDAITHGIPLDRLREMCDAEREQRCVVLPCKVGDTVWKIRAVFSYYSKPMEDRVGGIIISDKEILVCCTSGVKFSTDSVGKTVFLTREEAEAALDNKKGAE
jgi:hypothetical protein